jgi:hypothetical protein
MHRYSSTELLPLEKQQFVHLSNFDKAVLAPHFTLAISYLLIIGFIREKGVGPLQEQMNV